VLVVPLFFNYISKEQYGNWLAVNGLVALITAVDMGTDQYLATIVADDKKFYSPEIGHIVFSTLIIKLVIASLIAGVGFILYVFISRLLVIEPSILASAKNAYLISLLVLVCNLFAGTISTLLYGRHHFSLVNGLASASAVMASLGTIIFLALGFNISAFPLALLCSVFIQYSIQFTFLVKRYPHVQIKLKDFRFQNKKEMINYSVSFQILRWVHTLRSQYVVIAINNLISPSAAALYNLTNRLPQMVPLFASKITSPFFPSFAEFFANERIDLVASRFLKVSKLLFRFSLFFAILTFVVTKSFVTLWVGSSSFAGMSVLFLLSLSAFIFAAMGAFGIVIFASKKFEKWTFFSVIEIICAISLSYGLSFYFGLIGLIAGFVLASMITPIYLSKIVFKQLKLSFFDFSKSVLVYALVTNVSSLLFAFLIVTFFEISDWSELISVCLIFVLVHVILYEGVLMVKSKEIGFKAKMISAVKL
jgi:O-antigen/teichoic acid export membrane protein